MSSRCSVWILRSSSLMSQSGISSDLRRVVNGCAEAVVLVRVASTKVSTSARAFERVR